MTESRAAGSDLEYTLDGEAGDALVLVHGSWVDHHAWDLVAPMLTQSFRVVRYDRRGYDRHHPSEASYSFAGDAEDLIRLIEALDLQPVHLVGHSLGACVALRVAAERPDLLRSLVVHEPPLLGLLEPGDPDRSGFAGRAAPILERVRTGDARGAAERFVDAFAGHPGSWADLTRGTQEMMAAYAGRWLAEYEEGRAFGAPLPTLAEYLAPALVLSGANSWPLYARLADRLAQGLPNVVRQTLPRVGHLPHVTDPAMFVGVLFSFCAERIVPTS